MYRQPRCLCVDTPECLVGWCCLDTAWPWEARTSPLHVGPHEAPALQVEAKSPEVAEASHSAPGLRAGGLEMTPSFDPGLAWPGHRGRRLQSSGCEEDSAI